MHGRSVHGWHPRGDLDSTDGVGRLHRPHRHHHRAVKRPCRDGLEIGPVHRHIFSLRDVAQFDPRVDQGMLEGERTAEQKAHQIGAPKRGHVGHFLAQRTVPPNSVQRHVVADVDVAAERRQGRIARLGHRQQRTGLRVALTEAEKIAGQTFRQDHQIALRVARRQAAGMTNPFTAANGLARFVGALKAGLM